MSLQHKGRSITLRKLCGTDGYPSKAGHEIISIMESIPNDEWDLEMTIIFVVAVNCTRSKYDFNDLYSFLDKKRAVGIKDYEWNCAMANVLFNLQNEDENPVYFMRQAIKIAGGNPNIDYEKVIAVALAKVENNEEDELTDAEILALYLKENPSLIL